MLAHRRREDKPHRQIEIARHPRDHRALLKILQPEHRRIRLHDREKLQHHRRHAAEMARSRRAAQPARDAFLIHPRREIRAVHLARGRVENRVCSERRAQFFVLGKRSRVARQVFLRSELRGVYKNAHDHRAAFASERASTQDEGCVSVVQRAHRRHEHDTSARLCAEAPCGCDGTEDFHSAVGLRDQHTKGKPPRATCLPARVCRTAKRSAAGSTGGPPVLPGKCCPLTGCGSSSAPRSVATCRWPKRASEISRRSK